MSSIFPAPPQEKDGANLRNTRSLSTNVKWKMDVHNLGLPIGQGFLHASSIDQQTHPMTHHRHFLLE